MLKKKTTEDMNMRNEKEPLTFPLYCLSHGDPYNGLLESPYNWVV